MKTLNLFIIISFSTVYNGFVQQNLIRPKKEIKIALLGTYHFADSGQDKFNVNVDETNLRNGKKKIEDLNTASQNRKRTRTDTSEKSITYGTLLAGQ